MLQIIPRDKAETSAEYAYRAIRHNLVTMRIQPGSLVSEQEIAEQLGLSRTPVRDALRRLARAGIIEIIPQVGNRVAMIDYRLIEETRNVRLMLETAQIAGVCEKATDADFNRMEANVALQQCYLEKEDQEQLMLLDNALHRIFFEVTGNLLSHAIMQEVNIHFDRVRFVSLVDIRDNKTVEDHRAIAQALRDRDADKAAKLLTLHLTRFHADKATVSREYGKYILRQ